MVTRNSFRGTPRVPSEGLARRADKKYQHLAERYQGKFETALAVDGVVGFVWNKVKGTTSCTCRGFTLRNRYDISKRNKGIVAKGDDLLLDGDDVFSSSPEFESVDDQDQFTFVGDSVTRQKKDALGTKRSVSLTDREKLEQPSSKIKEAHDMTGDFASDDDILDFLEAEEPSGATPGSHQPMAHTPSSVSCGICLGMGTVDTWTLYGGQRIILDYSNKHVVELDNAEIEKTLPATFTVYDDTELLWRNVKLPQQWSKLLRVAVFNNGQVLDSDEYDLIYIHPNAPTTKNRLSLNTLNSLNATNLLVSNNKISVGLKAKSGKLQFTHVELLFQLNSPIKLQVPELDLADDSEFADWNLNASFEISSKIEVRESSYILESKYRRMWKVTSINKRLTATGKAFGYQVNVRALHPQEKAYVLLNFIGKPIDAFATTVDEVLDDFDF